VVQGRKKEATLEAGRDVVAQSPAWRNVLQSCGKGKGSIAARESTRSQQKPTAEIPMTAASFAASWTVSVR
jgi:hypothetical protein